MKITLIRIERLPAAMPPDQKLRNIYENILQKNVFNS